MNILNSIPNNIQNSLVDEQKKDNDQENGGPVWRLAQEEAADESTKHKNFEENNSSSLIDGTVRPGIVNQPVSGDSLLAMTLDRDSNGRQVPNLPDGNGYDRIYERADTRTTTTTRNDSDSGYSRQTKKPKVVELIIFGIFGLFGGFFGSIYVQSTCHFASAIVIIGDDQEFELHAGMWKYSSIDSVFNGYAYCSPYDDEYSSSAPMIARIFGLVALTTGTYTLTVLWIYLGAIRTTSFFWKWAIRMSYLATVLQLFTFVFFWSSFCARNQCSLGPGSLISFISAVSWFCVAYKMQHNIPLLAIMTIDKRSFLERNADKLRIRAVLEYFGWIEPRKNNVATLSSVAKMKKQKGLNRNDSFNTESSSRLSYSPPLGNVV